MLQLDRCEEQEFGFTHAHASAALMQRWGLPASMISLVRDHHGGGGEEQSQLNTRFLQLMRVGEAVSNMHDVPSPQRNATLQAILRPLSQDRSSEVRDCLEAAIATAGEMGKVFNIPVPEGHRWEELLDAIRDRVNQLSPALTTAG